MAISIEKTEFFLRFGKHLRSLRNDQNLSLRQLAQNCDLDYSDISKIEKGERNIQISTVFELAKGLNKHPQELFNFNIE